MKIADIVKQKEELISIKKGATKYTKGVPTKVINCDTLKNKSVLNKDNESSIERTVIGNTYLWMDSHGDVHSKGCFAKTIKERSESVFHLHDHEFKITSKVGNPIKIYEESIKWKDLGVNKSGDTEALFMDTEIIKSYNSQIFEEYKTGKINQHSVGMQYVKIDLAVNDEEYEDEYKVWKDNIDNIGNKDYAEEKGYFWLVREAKLIEISAVLLGSNELTPTLQADNKSLETIEAEKSLQLKHLLTIKI